MPKISDIDHERIAMIIDLQMATKGLNTTQLAKYLGCDHSTVSGWVNRHRPVPKDRVRKIAEAFDLDPRLIDARTA